MQWLRKQGTVWAGVAASIVALTPLCSLPSVPAHASRVPAHLDAPAASPADLGATGPITNCVPDARLSPARAVP